MARQDATVVRGLFGHAFSIPRRVVPVAPPLGDQLQLIAGLLKVEAYVALTRAYALQGDGQSAATFLLDARMHLDDICEDLASVGWKLDQYHKETPMAHDRAKHEKDHADHLKQMQDKQRKRLEKHTNAEGRIAEGLNDLMDNIEALDAGLKAEGASADDIHATITRYVADGRKTAAETAQLWAHGHK